MRFIFSAGFLVFILSASSALAFAAECIPSFPYSDGWLGGDDAYSIPLANGRSLWLFGDSFVGKPGQLTRTGSRMIANSVAISTCRRGAFDIDYYWRDPRSDSPGAFFDSGKAKSRLWPMDGFVYRGNLYILLREIVTTPKGGPFGFEGVGVKIATISNPMDRPEQWSIKYSDLVSGKVIFPGVAAIVQRNYVDLFAVLDDHTHKNHPMILTRLPLDHLNSAADAIEYLSQDGGWKRGLDCRNAKVVIEEGATEMSVRYHPAAGKWIAVQQKPGLRDGIGVRIADHIEGPWSPFQEWLIASETPPAGSDGGVFCYGAKEHPEYGLDHGNMIVSYVCNSLDFPALVSNMELYRPQVVRQRIPFSR